MRVRLRTTLAGPGLAGSPGDVVDLDDRRAEELVAAGYAVAAGARVPARAVPEAAVTAGATERAESVRPRRGRGP